MMYEPLIIDVGVGTNKRYRVRPLSLLYAYFKKILFILYSICIVTSYKLALIAIRSFISRIVSMLMLFAFFILLHLVLDHFGYKYTIGTLLDGVISVFTAVKNSEQLEHKVNSTLRLYLRKLYNKSDWFHHGEDIALE